MESSQNYIHSTKPSFLSRVFHFFMWLFSTNKYIEKTLIKGNLNQKPAPIPKYLKDNFEIEKEVILSRDVWTIKAKKSSPKKTIIYMHGGAYIFNISKYHWEFITDILSKTSARIIVVDYPLAPNNSHKDIHNLMKKVYENTLDKIPSKEIVFLGDSAGAGFLFTFSQYLRNNNLQQASKSILISPWLDLSLSNPELPKIEENDVVLSIKGLRLAASSIAGELTLNDPKLSPLYNSFENLNPIYIFFAGNELFSADILQLKNKTKNKAKSIFYYEYPNMFHDWAIFTYLKESKVAINQIVKIINS